MQAFLPKRTTGKETRRLTHSFEEIPLIQNPVIVALN
jgi:hypothetical protein